jgi:hypothetical protein
MSDKLNLNKIFLIFVILISFQACKYRVRVNTEVICPNQKIMIRFAKSEEVRQAMERALADKKKYGTSENYTVIRLWRNRSFKIEKVAPEDIVKCTLQEHPLSPYDEKIIDYYFDDEVD